MLQTPSAKGISTMTSPSDACGFREARECACAPGSCRVQPAPVEILHQPRIRDGIYASIVIGGIAALLAFYSIPRAAEVSHQIALDRQEQVHALSR
jgi:hypothetical protein